MYKRQDVNGRNKIKIESALSSKSLDLSSDSKENKVSSGNFITARPLGVIDGVDMQFSGQIRRIDETSIKNKLDNKEIVIISPLGFSPIGDIFNLSYEKTAAHVSSAIKADKLIYYINHNGILNLKGDLISELTTHKAENLIKSIENNSSPGEELFSMLLIKFSALCVVTVSYTHLTLPTIYSV